MTYEPFTTDAFDAALHKLPRSDQRRVSRVIENRISADPYHNSKLLTGDVLEGLRSFRIGKYRLVFLVVEEIRRMGLEDTNPHLDCAGIPAMGIKLLFVGLRKDVYRWSP